MVRVLLVVVCIAASSCAPDGSGRVRTSFAVEIEGSGDVTSTTNAGATVTLNEATVSLGALSWFEGDALFARSFVHELLSFSAARAHPGHYTPGEALADMDVIGIVDLLADAPVTLTADGLTGAYGSVSVPLTPVDGATLRLAGDVVFADDSRRAFSAVVVLTHTVEGIAANADVDGGVMRVSISHSELVRRIDFAAASTSQPDGVIDLIVVEQANNALSRALESQGTYVVTYTKG